MGAALAQGRTRGLRKSHDALDRYRAEPGVLNTAPYIATNRSGASEKALMRGVFLWRGSDLSSVDLGIFQRHPGVCAGRLLLAQSRAWLGPTPGRLARNARLRATARRGQSRGVPRPGGQRGSAAA